MQLCLEFFGALFLLIFIVFSCSLFTNAVEHFGLEFKYGKNAVGSIFAALGTTAPETIVPLVAIIGGIIAGNETVACEIGIGAILGSPFLLSTITFFFMGVGIYIFKWAKSRKSLNLDIDNRYIIRDFKFFFVNYFVAVGASFVKFPLVKLLALLFLIISYIYYFVQTLKRAKNSDDVDSEIEELAFAKICKFNKRFAIFIQVVFSLLLLILCAHLFVLKIKFFPYISGNGSICDFSYIPTSAIIAFALAIFQAISKVSFEPAASITLSAPLLAVSFFISFSISHLFGFR